MQLAQVLDPCTVPHLPEKPFMRTISFLVRLRTYGDGRSKGEFFVLPLRIVQKRLSEEVLLSRLWSGMPAGQ